jgi:hypothetical protein
MKIKSFIFFTFLVLSNACFSQNITEEKDTVTVYENIKEFSGKSKFSKFVYKLIFKSRNKKTPTTKIKPKETVLSPSSKLNFDSKIIRNIYIETYDPFGYSIQDSLKKPKKRIDKFGNAVHLKTKKITIKNLLLFKKGDSFDQLKINESERLIRSQRYTRRVAIIPLVITNEKDSVDVIIKVLDSWSLLPNGSLSANQASGKLTERNLFGLGHSISGVYKTRFEDKEKAISGFYSINNIKNTYLQLNLGYTNDFGNNSRRSVNLKRDFFSPLTKWAGGIYFENKIQNEIFVSIPDTIVNNIVKSERQEYWFGKSFKIFNSNEYFKRSTRLITSIAYQKTNYLSKPTSFADPYAYFSNSRSIIGQIGITSQKYYKDKFLFNYDIIEDVPYGEIAALIVGMQNKNNQENLYLGAKVSRGRKYNFGYASFGLEWGSFFNNNKALQTAFKTEINYISPLMELKKWKIRQFIKPTYIWGNNRNTSEKDKLSLNENYGIQGFNSPILGTQKWLISFQTQTYTPGSWYGFRFSPYVNCTLGSINNKSANLFKNKVYSKIGIGALINNDFLVFNSFQISFSYYPTIPFEGDNLLKTNSFENNDLSLPDFQLNKPEYINYQ